MMIKLTQSQAKEFAHSIFLDIAEYVRAHQAEYEAFLAEQGGTYEQ